MLNHQEKDTNIILEERKAFFPPIDIIFWEVSFNVRSNEERTKVFWIRLRIANHPRLLIA